MGLAPGLFDAGEAIWNLRLVSATPPTEPFVGQTNSDLAFTGPYAIQGNYDGIQIWDISDPASPESVITYVCPASQSDVSVYEHLLFVSGEGFGGRLDCGGEGIEEAVSHDRLRGIRIFDISDITAPEYVANVQTCRGSHTHTVLEHPATTRTCTSTSPARLRYGPPRSCPAVPAHPRRRIPTRRSSASRSSGCPWRIRPAPPS